MLCKPKEHESKLPTRSQQGRGLPSPQTRLATGLPSSMAYLAWREEASERPCQSPNTTTTKASQTATILSLDAT